MQVAVCISGHLRSFELTWKSLQKFIISPLKADVFIHTWNMVGHSPHIDAETIYLKTNSVLNKIMSYYNPKQIIIEPLNKVQGEEFRQYLIDERNPVGVTNMFYKIYKADQLRQNYHSKYDLVIRVRPDLMFNSPINMQHVTEAIKENCLFLPSFGHFTGFNDQFAFGSSEAMSFYSNCYNELSKLAPKTPFVPERLLKTYLLDNKISIKFTPIDYNLIRANGTIFDNKFHSPGIPELK